MPIAATAVGAAVDGRALRHRRAVRLRGRPRRARLGRPRATLLLAGSALYPVGVIALTIAYNVPLNDRLAGVHAHAGRRGRGVRRGAAGRVATGRWQLYRPDGIVLDMPAFLLLSLAIVSEVGATLALRMSDGFSRPMPSVVVVLGYGISFWFLALALKDIPVSLTYAIWSGVGTALVAVAGVVAFGESMNVMKLASLGVIILGVVGLSAAGGAH
jgi:small multidrug resistance pump